jgi:mannose-6-phosphate isomerase-like protein (cupin superfamily)
MLLPRTGSASAGRRASPAATWPPSRPASPISGGTRAGDRRSRTHGEAEEIYLVLTGSGTMRLDGDLLEVGPLDAIRVAPGVARGFEAGAEGLEFVAVGPHVAGDGQLVDDGRAQDG